VARRQRHPVHPWLNGERSPVDDHTIRGAFNNLSLATSRPDLVRAVYEGVALNTRCSSVRSSALWTATRSTLPSSAEGQPRCMAQIHADVTVGASGQVADPVLANVRGAALTFLALGRVKVEDISDMVDVRATFERDLSQANVYDSCTRSRQPLQAHQTDPQASETTTDS